MRIFSHVFCLYLIDIPTARGKRGLSSVMCVADSFPPLFRQTHTCHVPKTAVAPPFSEAYEKIFRFNM